jgi:SAM-dependent methyltransferase
MSQDHQDPSAADNQPSPPTAARFDTEFATVAGSPGVRRVWQQATPDLPPAIEPYSFASVALRGHVANALALSPGKTLVDLGCGRGGPGLWLAQSQDTLLIGVDFSAVAVQQATARAALFGLADRARFVVGDLAATGLPNGAADAVVSIDALHFAADPTAAAREVVRLLRPGGRLVLTNWQPRSPADSQLPSRMRIDWAATLRSAGFADVRVESRGLSGTTCSPGCSRSRWSSVIQARTLDWPGFRTRRVGLSPWRSLLTGLLAQRPVPIASSG